MESKKAVQGVWTTNTQRQWEKTQNTSIQNTKLTRTHSVHSWIKLEDSEQLVLANTKVISFCVCVLVSSQTLINIH